MDEHRLRRPDVSGRDPSEHPTKLGENPDKLRELVEGLRCQLGEELMAARDELAGCRTRAERLPERLSNFEREHRRVCDGYAALEGQIAELGNVCVVMERLHGTIDHGEVLAAIQDVVINVIGSEELALFELTDDGRSLRPTQSFGVEGRRLGSVPVGVGPIGRAAGERKGWVVGEGPPPPEYPDMTACVPLQAGDSLAGVLAIWRMLPHKPVFGDADRNVLELLSRHAGTALHLTSHHERPRRVSP